MADGRAEQRAREAKASPNDTWFASGPDGRVTIPFKALADDVLAEVEARKAAERVAATLRQALEQIVANAEDWHGVSGDRGHERALAVIATWGRAALAAAGETETGPA